jgi:hypothetical protein
LPFLLHFLFSLNSFLNITGAKMEETESILGRDLLFFQAAIPKLKAAR